MTLQIFLECSPRSLWFHDPIWRAYFSNGWFNHQLGTLLSFLGIQVSVCMYIMPPNQWFVQVQYIDSSTSFLLGSSVFPVKLFSLDPFRWKTMKKFIILSWNSNADFLEMDLCLIFWSCFCVCVWRWVIRAAATRCALRCWTKTPNELSIYLSIYLSSQVV